MTKKILGEIRKVALNDATFKDTNAYFEPTYVNFFFGNNGVGKSTIARALKSGHGLEFAPGMSSSDYVIHVYDQDYINNNMQSYQGLPGVFTMDSENIEIQNQIDAKTEEKRKSEKLISDANEKISNKNAEATNLQAQLEKDCWQKTYALRTEYKNTQEGLKSSKQKFVNELKRHNPVEHDPKELKRTYDSAYSETAKRYQTFNDIEDARVLDNLEGKEILGISIVNAAETDLARFWKEIGALEWVADGHQRFKQITRGRCPYCNRELDDDFETKLIASFDDRYTKNKEKLNQFLQAYRDAANRLFVPLQHTPQELYPEIDKKTYDDKLAALQGVIASNVDRIKQKVAEPERIVSLEDTEPMLADLQKIIDGYNILIGKNNEIVAAGPTKRMQCRNDVFEQMAYECQDIFTAYERSIKQINKDIADQQLIINTQKASLKTINNDLKVLNSQTVDTETAMNAINTMLRNSGFQGFELRPRKEAFNKPDGTPVYEAPVPPRNYEVVRTDTGKVAEHLSEGEKNFIAFMYFEQQVFGKATASDDDRKKIVVIDDPVSSMDSSTLFMVSAEVRNMIEICRNNADNRNAVTNKNFIKQIFILTHNPYFHRDVANPYVKHFEYVSYYLVQKFNNRSSVTLKKKQNPEIPSEEINVNPVKNAYAALWDEYKEVSGGIVLMNVIRRILEYYFIQLSGYEGYDLRQRILKDHKEEFMHDDEGNEDDTKYRMASAMLSYIASSAGGVIDGINYIDDSVDTETCKETFHMIFKTMGQEQHYNMMMGIN